MKKVIVKNDSIVKKILLPMTVLLLVQAVLFCGTIFAAGTVNKLSQNAEDILNERVINRKNYLQGEMLQRWSALSGTQSTIEAVVQDLLENRHTSISALRTDDSLANEILNRSYDELVYILRKNSVTGAFLILETNSVEEGDIRRLGLYIRDQDPVSTPQNDSDLLLERGSSHFNKEKSISLDSYWSPYFVFDEDGENSRYYSKPFEAAQAYPDADAQDLGYWSPPFCLDEKDQSNPVITYSIPLKDESGSPYGVLGVEISVRYLQKQLPYGEITTNKDKGGSYFLGIQDGDSFLRIATTGPKYMQLFGDESIIYPLEHHGAVNVYEFQQNESSRGEPYGCVQQFHLYNTHTPFEEEQWVLLGIVDKRQLFAFSHKVTLSILAAAVISLLVGIIGLMIISRIVSQPIITLAGKVRKSNPRLPVHFGKINIREIDELSDSIEKLSSDVAESASKLSQIIEMTSDCIGAFEIHRGDRQVFYTKRFFGVLQVEGRVTDGYMTLEEFRRILNEIPYTVEAHADSRWEVLFCPDDATKWARLRVLEDENKVLGVAEDVTKEILEKRKIEYERDYDILTNLLNRRAFHSEMEYLFFSHQKIKTAALLMMDLDNLKYVNDTYGHDYGDQYIQLAAQVLQESAPPAAIVSRMSGDEFYLFLWGYEERQPIQSILANLKAHMAKTILPLPDNTAIRLRASAGIAWYPDDSENYQELIRYADFAMYTVKNSVKGEFSEFDLAEYQKNSYLLRKREELNNLLDNRLVEYYYQPIVDVKTGEVFAYEALMRSKLETLKSTMEILSLARSQSKLLQLEQLTWFEAIQFFERFPAVPPCCKLFINSVANQELSNIDKQKLQEEYGDKLSRVVIEITESEKSEQVYTVNKRDWLARYGGQMALDDFGTGYNSETMLLNVAPDYIKVDMSIVRNIHRDPNRQQILINLVSYAHGRNIKVISEGVEDREEMALLVETGVDYLQGFYLGRPSPIPLEVADSIHFELLTMQK